MQESQDLTGCGRRRLSDARWTALPRKPSTVYSEGFAVWRLPRNAYGALKDNGYVLNRYVLNRGSLYNEWRDACIRYGNSGQREVYPAQP